MSETAKINYHSVNPKQPTRRQKSPKKKQRSIGKQESKKNKSKQESAKASCKVISLPDEIKNETKNFCNNRPWPLKENLTSTSAQMKNNDYGIFYLDLLEFENPKIKYLRTHLYFLITCHWCHNLFDFERAPRIYEGVTVCSLCLNDVLTSVPAFADSSFPLDLCYISAVNRIHQTYSIFKSENPYYNELERSIYKKKKIVYTNRLPAADLDQKAYLLSSIKLYKNHIIGENIIKFYTIFSKIGAIDNFKSNLMNAQQFSSLQQDALEIFENLDEYGSLLLPEPAEEIPAQESWEGLLSSQNHSTDPLPLVFTKMTTFNVINGDVELYFYVDIDGKRLYAMVYGTGMRFYVESFKPKLKPISSVGIARFVRLKENFLSYINIAYFEISPEKNSMSLRYNGKSLRCYLMLGLLDNSWQAAKLFLGSKNANYLGAEIEVTEELVKFNYYLKDDKPMTDNIDEPILWEYWHIPSYVHQGMIVCHSVDHINMLTIYKYDKPTKLENLIIGYVERSSYGSLMKIPLGKHKIIASGVGIQFNG